MSIKATIKDIFQVGLATNGQEISKEEKIKLMDAALDDSMGRPKGLLITANFSNPGKRINNRVYAPIAQRDSLSMWTSPAPLPLLRNHDTDSEPLGRVVSVDLVDYSEQLSGYFRDQRELQSFLRDMYSDDPRKIQSAMNQRGFLQNPSWPGVAELRGKVRVGDKEAIEKFFDGRYLTLSASAVASQIMCGTCGCNWAMGEMCEHLPGDAVEDGPGYHTIVAMDYGPREISVVNIPANKTSMVHSMEMVDNEGNDLLSEIRKNKKKLWAFSDCAVQHNANVELFEDSYGSKECECAPEPCTCEDHKDEEFDHSLTINKADMEVLHSTGQVDIKQSAEGQHMVIRVLYPDYQPEESLEAPAHPVEDAEKKFKVPAGARGNAKKVLEWKEEHGDEVKGMTQVGWARARQLASQEEIPLSTIKRMAAFNRHRENAAIDPKFKDTPWKDRGYVAWLGWGGDTGVDWAIEISKNNDSVTEDACRADSEIEWDLIDTLLQIEVGDKSLSTEERKALPDSAFCGPNRSFPVPDCEHYTAALRLLGRAKLTESQKTRVKSCVMKKGDSLGCTKNNDSEDSMSKEILDLLDSVIVQKLITSSKSENNVFNLSDDDYLFEGNKIPVANKQQVEVALQVVSEINLNDEQTNLLTKRLTARLEAMQDSETKEMEELISKFTGLGLDDAQARAAAVVHLIKTTELTDEERTALFAPAPVAVEDEALKADHAKLLEDHSKLQEELAALKAQAEEPVVEIQDSEEEAVAEEAPAAPEAAEAPQETEAVIVEDAATTEETVEVADSEEPAAEVVADATVQEEAPEKVDNPSASLIDAVNNDSQVAELTDYQKSKVEQYKQILDSESEESAERYISMLKRLNRLPVDFDIKPHLK